MASAAKAMKRAFSDGKAPTTSKPAAAPTGSAKADKSRSGEQEALIAHG